MRRKRIKTWMAMKLCTFLMLVGMFPVSAKTSAQFTKISMELKEQTLSQALWKLDQQTDFTFFYNVNDVAPYSVSECNFVNTPLDKVLDKLLNKTNLEYEVQHDAIVIKSKAILQQQQDNTAKFISGSVKDNSGMPLPGATIRIKGANIGVTTDAHGVFKLQMVNPVGKTIIVSFIGYKSKEIIIKESLNISVTLQEDESEMDEVVVTGLYSRKKESFTGSATTYTNEDLKKVSSVNLLQSLKTLDPAFAMMDSKQWGSDPNRLPDIEIRGTTSVKGLQTEFGEDPNRPLFVLDGVECSLQDIVNLNMDRVASITILKDAASTAIYGSKAANGVVVVETVAPKVGKLRLSYNGNFVLQIPDLTDYNLMNASEKLEFERIAGVYKSDNYGSTLALEEEYNYKLKEVLRGVDTYWMSEPLRTAVNNVHNIMVDGGNESMRYMLGVNYNGNNGVMKGSNNRSIGANIKLTYRTQKLLFSNNFNTSILKTEREPVAFSEFSKQNPYTRKTNSEGYVTKYIPTYNANDKLINPVWLSQLDNTTDNKGNTYSNTFNVEWRAFNSFRLSGQFNIQQTINKTTSFESPDLPKFDDVQKLEKGSYSYSNSSGFTYSGNVRANYGEILGGVHQINIVGGWSFNDSETVNNGYSVRGFVSSLSINPQFSSGFKDGQIPTYSKNKSRETSFFANANYGYANRYLLDANIRLDGTSRFGSSKLFSTTWAVGLAWNLHNEDFVKELGFVSIFKIRASIGNPGNQNFDPYMAYKIYTYNTSYQNMFGPSATISSFGNKNLKWQRTMDRNIGLDMTLFDNRLTFNVDYYNKKTDPLLLSISLPISTGTSSINSNLGGQISKGFNGNMVVRVIRNKTLSWSVNANFRTGKKEYFGIGKTLDALNKAASDKLDPAQSANILNILNQTDALTRYYDGADPDDLYAVRSLGIDPATGREMFLTKDGEQVFVYNHQDQVKVGNSRADVEGVIGTSLNWKGLSLSMNFRYTFGADVMASALYSKVENLNTESLKYNQDKRALYDRWQKPGDIAKFSSIQNIKYETAVTPMSSRFLMTEKTLSMESFSLSYDFSGVDLKKSVGIQGINVAMYMNNIFRISSVKEERGLDYPFARSMTFSIGLRF